MLLLHRFRRNKVKNRMELIWYMDSSARQDRHHQPLDQGIRDRAFVLVIFWAERTYHVVHCCLCLTYETLSCQAVFNWRNMTANNDARAWIDPWKQFAGVLNDSVKLPLRPRFPSSGLGRGIFHTVGCRAMDLVTGVNSWSTPQHWNLPSATRGFESHAFPPEKPKAVDTPPKSWQLSWFRVPKSPKLNSK